MQCDSEGKVNILRVTVLVFVRGKSVIGNKGKKITEY